MGSKLSTKLYGIVGVLLGIMVVMAIVSFFTLRYISTKTKNIERVDAAQLKLALEAEVNTGHAIDNFKNFVIRKDMKYVAGFKENFDRVNKGIKAYIALATTPAEKEAADNALKGAEIFAKAMATLENAILITQDTAVLDKMVSGVDDPLYTALDQMGKIATTEYGENSNRLIAVSSTLNVVMIVSTLIAIILGLSLSTYMIGKIVRPVIRARDAALKASKGDLTVRIETTSTDELGEMAANFNTMTANLREMLSRIVTATSSLLGCGERLSSSISVISSGVDEQASRTAQVASATEEMSQTVVDIARNASSIADSSVETLSSARDGEGVVHKTVNEVEEIAKTVKRSSELISSLGERSKQIGEIVNVIKDIADQTNLLALNAAIEAARAGDQGRGFAVVADEVRKLAERTGKATAEISNTIGVIQSETGQAVEAMDESLAKVETGVALSTQAGHSLGNIVESINGLKSMVTQIASATEEMSATSESISRDIDGIAVASRAASAESGGISQASDELSRIAAMLQKEISAFRL